VCNITKLQVDAIVNAANGKLIHAGGVANAIADAAGSKFSKACYRHVNTHGEIVVTENAITSSGDLPCRAVIHAVGPRMMDYRHAADCYKDLYKAFMNCLMTASHNNFTSLAIPAVSSGKF
jgi:O-acetyl-ADP-ribose deacetylase (regulator of RNase III)